MKLSIAVSQNGKQLTNPIAEAGVITDPNLENPMTFFHLARITENYLENLGKGAPAHVTVEMEDEMLFIGSAVLDERKSTTS